jgi:hypothetical protein
MLKFDLLEGMKDAEFASFVKNFVSLDDDLRSQVYKHTFALSLVQSLHDGEELPIDSYIGPKIDCTALENDIVDDSVEPQKIRLNNKRFFCECGCDDFYPDWKKKVLVCKACNSSYNL